MAITDILAFIGYVLVFGLVAYIGIVLPVVGAYHTVRAFTRRADD